MFLGIRWGDPLSPAYSPDFSPAVFLAIEIVLYISGIGYVTRDAGLPPGHQVTMVSKKSGVDLVHYVVYATTIV
jgi:hypothetical protein